jgi:hypothetical protein
MGYSWVYQLCCSKCDRYRICNNLNGYNGDNMKVNISIDLTPEEAKDLFVPGNKQQEFMTQTYDAYVAALKGMVWDQIDPYNYFKNKNNDS